MTERDCYISTVVAAEYLYSMQYIDFFIILIETDLFRISRNARIYIELQNQKSFKLIYKIRKKDKNVFNL